MIKLQSFLLSVVLISSQLVVSSSHGSVYYSELKQLKTRQDTRVMFDEDAHVDLGMIQRDIINFKELSSFQRFVRSVFLGFDVIVVTPDTLPKLYAYVESVCRQGGISMPTVFITRHKSFFNAFAQKLLMSTGGIVIGQKLMQESSTEEIEAVVAHEIGHIKHNHINKNFALKAIKFAAYVSLMVCFYKDGDILEVPIEDLEGNIVGKTYNLNMFYLKHFIINSVLAIAKSLVINKRFEKEADLFACECGKGQGMIDFFEHTKEREQKREDEFAVTYDLLQHNKEALSSDYNGLVFRYHLAKIGHNISKAFKYVYHNTSLGAHPSNQARIDAAKKYLAQQQA